jgi:hypothetical protein
LQHPHTLSSPGALSTRFSYLHIDQNVTDDASGDLTDDAMASAQKPSVLEGAGARTAVA